MQTVVCPPPCPGRMKCKVYVEVIPGHVQHTLLFAFPAHAIIAMSRIMDVSSKMGPWMLRGWVRVSENSKENSLETHKA